MTERNSLFTKSTKISFKNGKRSNLVIRNWANLQHRLPIRWLQVERPGPQQGNFQLCQIQFIEHHRPLSIKGRLKVLHLCPANMPVLLTYRSNNYRTLSVMFTGPWPLKIKARVKIAGTNQRIFTTQTKTCQKWKGYSLLEEKVRTKAPWGHSVVISNRSFK